MPLGAGIVVGIALGAAITSFLLTTIAFLRLRRHEDLIAAKKELIASKRELIAAKKEAEMAPIVREKKSDEYWLRRDWLKMFDEFSLCKSDGLGAQQFEDKWWMNYVGDADGLSFLVNYGLPMDAPLNLATTTGKGDGQPPPHDIAAALTHYFDGQLELGIDHRIISRLLFHTERDKRVIATEFLFNKAALSFCNWGSNPKYALLPPKILELFEELNVRVEESHDNVNDRLGDLYGPNPYKQIVHRWRAMTFAMYGRTNMPPEIQISMDRRVNFLMTVLSPILKPDSLSETRKIYQEIVTHAHKMALFCADQRTLTVNSWDYTARRHKFIYTGDPRPIPPFDMMAEKTLVVRPAYLFESSEDLGMPFIDPYPRKEAKLVKFSDKEWSELTKDL